MITVPFLAKHDNDTYRVVQVAFESTRKRILQAEPLVDADAESSRVRVPKATFLYGAHISVCIANASKDSPNILRCFDVVHVKKGGVFLGYLCSNINALLLTERASRQLLWYAKVFSLLRLAGFDKFVADLVLSFCALGESPLNTALFANSFPIGGIARRFRSFYLRHRRSIDVPLYLHSSEAYPEHESVSLSYISKLPDTRLNLHLIDAKVKLPLSDKRERYRWHWWPCDTLQKAFRHRYLMYKGRRAGFILLSIFTKQHALDDVSQRFFTKAIVEWQDEQEPQWYSSEQSFVRRIGNEYWFLFREDRVANTDIVLDDSRQILSDELVLGQTFVARKHFDLSRFSLTSIRLAPATNSGLNLDDCSFKYWIKTFFLAV